MSTIQATVNYPTKKRSKRMQKNSVRQTNKLWEQASWLRRRTENIGLCWGFTRQSYDGHPHQRMGRSTISWSHVLSDLIAGSHSDEYHHRWIPRGVFTQQTQLEHNACGIYHTECFRRIRYWWRLVPPWQSVNIQGFHQWRIYAKNPRCSGWTIYTWPL